MEKAKNALFLFFTMFKIGLFTFGGGYAMLALLENEFVARKQWMTGEEFLDMVAVAESTPGPVAINSATYIGYRRAGVFGSAMATLGVCLPSFSIIFIISLFFDKFLAFRYVQYAFEGIRACVVLLIGSAGWKLWKGLPKKPFQIVVFCAAIGCMIAFGIFSIRFSTVFYILIGAALGICLYLVSLLREKEKKA